MLGGLHHLHARHRAAKKRHESPYPHPVKWKRTLDRVMYVVAIITPLLLLPQVYELYTSHDAAGLNLLTWSLLAAVKLLWVLYGIAHRAYPILISNLIFTVIDGLIISGIILFR